VKQRRDISKVKGKEGKVEKEKNVGAEKEGEKELRKRRTN
jgi:hypothetical protein